jgi:RimJ/RimL family protein N-acetyltransferase
MTIQPVTLNGKVIRLEPLSMKHFSDLCEIGLDQDLWKITMTIIRTPEEMKSYIDEAVRLQELGSALPFAIVEQSSGKAIGSTRFGNLDRTNRRVEIGWTWVARKWQRTAVNTEAKLLLLTHAFETLKYIRVEFKTDSLNQQSRNALLRIGAKEEGVLRNHMIAPGGRIRHSVYFSIIDSEWIEVKKRLRQNLDTSL